MITSIYKINKEAMTKCYMHIPDPSEELATAPPCDWSLAWYSALL